MHVAFASLQDGPKGADGKELVAWREIQHQHLGY